MKIHGTFRKFVCFTLLSRILGWSVDLEARQILRSFAPIPYGRGLQTFRVEGHT